MDLTGFTSEQLTVRDGVSQICSQFPSTYWQECDQQERDPKEFHAALARDGWLGIALPEEFGGSGLGTKGPFLFLFPGVKPTEPRLWS
jgi:acyl-CoA dehydrogenase